jgi:hypothetical protein
MGVLLNSAATSTLQEWIKRSPLTGTLESEMRYRHYFKCSDCGSVASYLSKYEVYDKRDATFEASCLCGKNLHSYLDTMIVHN